ncbi:MAG: hypothetical protein KDB18_09475, partial [Salinibacterium sp.]|nr:hypothetical protein [Salinibacterium sp.]
HGAFNLPVQASMMVGAGGDRANLAFNAEPAPITYEQFRQSIEDWMEEVKQAERELSRVGDEPVKVRVPIGLARIDLNMDGQASEREQAWRLFTAVQRRFRPTQESAEGFEIAFDRGDVAWLRGYCNVCLAVGEFLLAHDTSDLFERAGHLFFAKNETPFGFLKGDRKSFDFGTGIDASDAVAFIHLLDFDVVEPDRMAASREHLLSAIGLADEMWRWYDAETDDDQEWIPNPKQRECAIPGGMITPAMRDAWLRTLGETREMLNGERLLRFWRGDGDRGVNVRRVFMEPRRFDVVLWVQGSAAGPYLEEGEFTSDGLWADLEDAFDRGVFRYMWWMN